VQTYCSTAINCSVVVASKSAFNLKSNFTLLVVEHFHPLFVNPSAQRSQLFGYSKHVAQD